MRTFSRALFSVLLLLLGLGVGFQTGRESGFETGSEWALVQAQIYAREAGMDMPVVLDQGTFRIVMKQPPGVYRRAWRMADEFDGGRMERPLKKEEQTDEFPGGEERMWNADWRTDRDPGLHSSAEEITMYRISAAGSPPEPAESPCPLTQDQFDAQSVKNMLATNDYAHPPVK